MGERRARGRLRRWGARRRARGEHGAVVVLVALSMLVVIAATSLAVDIGQVAVAARQSRTVADLAALDAARRLDPSQASGPQLTVVRAAAERSGVRNGLSATAAAALEVTLGAFDRTTRTFTPAVSTATATAVQVTARRTVKDAFLPGSFVVARTAVATTGDGVAEVVLATTTASVDTNRSAVLNAVLGKALGSSVSLTAVSWQGLAGARVDLASLAVGLGLGADDVATLLDRTFTTTQIVTGLSKAVAGTPAAAALAPIVGVGSSPLSVKLRDLITVDGPGPDTQLLSFSAVDLLWGVSTAAVVNGSVDVDLALGGTLGSVPAHVTVIQPPVIAVGRTGTTVRSAQLRATIAPTVAALSVPLLTSSAVTVPLVIGTGRGSATISTLACAGGAEPTHVDLDVRTAAATVQLGTVAGNGSVDPATLVELRALVGPPVRVTSSTTMTVASGAGTASFVPPYAWGSFLRISASGNPASVLAVTGSGLQISPSLGGLTDALVSTATLNALNPVLTAAVPPVLKALGMELGVADVDVPMGTCRATGLVG